MTREEILTKKKDGDWVVVGKMVGCTADCARFRFGRPNSKKYPAVFDALKKVVETREALLNDATENF